MSSARQASWQARRDTRDLWQCHAEASEQGWITFRVNVKANCFYCSEILVTKLRAWRLHASFVPTLSLKSTCSYRELFSSSWPRSNSSSRSATAAKLFNSRLAIRAPPMWSPPRRQNKKASSLRLKSNAQKNNSLAGFSTVLSRLASSEFQQIEHHLN